MGERGRGGEKGRGRGREKERVGKRKGVQKGNKGVGRAVERGAKGEGRVSGREREGEEKNGEMILTCCAVPLNWYFATTVVLGFQAPSYRWKDGREAISYHMKEEACRGGATGIPSFTTSKPSHTKCMWVQYTSVQSACNTDL